MFETFHFLRPEWLWAIIPVSLLLFFSIKSIKHSSAWDGVCDAPLLQYQLTQQQNNSKKSTRLLRWLIPFSFLMLLFSFTIIALAGPSWEKKDQPVFQQEDALVIVLDLSLSMNAEDIKPSRLERAKLKLTDILKRKKEGQTALVAFAGDAHIVSPLTIDNKTIISLLPALDITIMPLSGSHINDALSSAAELLKNSGFMHGDILLLTDGIDEQHTKKVRKKINSLRNQGYNLSIIGIGSRAGSPITMPGSGGFIKDNTGQVVLSKLNAAPLKELARLGGGSYHALSLDDSDFESLLDKSFSNNNKLTEQDKQDNYQQEKHEQWVDAGAYIILLILPLALLVFRRGLLSISLLFLISSSFFIKPTIAQAVSEAPDSDAARPEASKSETAAVTQFTQNKSWKNLWSTPDQQGQKAFNNKNYKTAAEQFNNSHWKAGSYYRAGKYEQAIEQYEQLNDADSLFNKGNSLAHLQQYEEAIQSYDDALEKNPDLSDAIKNRDAIQEFLDKQKQQSEQQQQQESDSSKDENKDKEQQQNNDQDSKQGNSDQQENDQSKQQEQQNNSENNNSEQDSEQSSEQNSDQNSEQQQDPQNNQSEQPDEAADEKQKQSQQQQAEDEAEEKDPHKAEQQQMEKIDAEAGENTADDVLSQLSQEEQQSLKQWLQRIPDNPGELLRIKFRNNSLNKQRQQNTPEQYEGNPW